MPPFVDNMTVPDLGFGGEFSLWGFRTIASGRSNTCQLNIGFNRAFAMECASVNRRKGGTRCCLALNALKSFVMQMASAGQRKITLSGSGALHLTADELHIVAALSAAQSNHQNECDAHLLQLMRSPETKLARQAAQTFGVVCANAGIMIDAPDMNLCPCRNGNIPMQAFFGVVNLN